MPKTKVSPLVKSVDELAARRKSALAIVGQGWSELRSIEEREHRRALKRTIAIGVAISVLYVVLSFYLSGR